MSDVETLDNPDPRPEVPVSKQGDPVSLGGYLYERLKSGPRGPVIDLVAVGPLAVANALKGVIEANSRLARSGVYLSLVPAMRRTPRRGSEYGESSVTVLGLILQDMD